MHHKQIELWVLDLHMRISVTFNFRQLQVSPTRGFGRFKRTVKETFMIFRNKDVCIECLMLINYFSKITIFDGGKRERKLTMNMCHYSVLLR